MVLLINPLLGTWNTGGHGWGDFSRLDGEDSHSGRPRDTFVIADEVR